MDQPLNDILSSIDHSAATIRSLRDQARTVQSMSDTVVRTLRSGGKVLTAGYGGSAADALHMAEELVGRFEADRPSLPAVALAADPTLITCIGNDYGFERLFARQVEGLGREGDVLVLFSTSGRSPGLRAAVEAARSRGAHSMAILGKGGGELRGNADHELIVADHSTARIQEAHTLILHLILEAVEREFTASENEPPS